MVKLYDNAFNIVMLPSLYLRSRAVMAFTSNISFLHLITLALKVSRTMISNDCIFIELKLVELN